MTDSGLKNKVALVTGASGGIGSAVMAALQSEGAKTVGWDISPAPDSDIRYVDVTDADSVGSEIERIESAVGPVDVLVNVAGILITSSVVDTSDSEWRRLFSVNVDGVFNVSREVARRMALRKRGSIVTVSSNAGGIPRVALSAYAASKAAATMFTRCLGLELAPLGIRCNVVAPGSTRTQMLDTMLADGGTVNDVLKGSLENFRTGIPLGRIGEPTDVAETVVFLASDRARHITMATLFVDGGATLHG